MVLPLVDEDKPKCYLCHEGFEDIEKLKEHQNIAHKDFFESNEKQTNRESAPGDVTVF
jgi:quinol monooxygenase YgiN